jgi:steroid delta-isomerase-like uncharacterized protein
MDPEATVRQLYEVMSTGEGDLLDEVLAEDWEDIPLPPGWAPGREGYKNVGLVALRTMFPDFEVTNEDIIVSADGSKVTVRSVSRGTHSGEIFGIPATGKEVAFRAIDIHQLENGKIARSWHLEDFLEMVMQLGAQIVPAQP